MHAADTLCCGCYCISIKVLLNIPQSCLGITLPRYCQSFSSQVKVTLQGKLCKILSMWLKLSTDWLVSLSTMIRSSAIDYCETESEAFLSVDNGRQNCHRLWHLSMKWSRSLMTYSIILHKANSICTLLVEYCFMSTKTVDLLRKGAQDGHLDFHTAPELRPSTHCLPPLSWTKLHTAGKRQRLFFSSSGWSINKCCGIHLIIVARTLLTKWGMYFCGKIARWRLEHELLLTN